MNFDKISKFTKFEIAISWHPQAGSIGPILVAEP